MGFFCCGYCEPIQNDRIQLFESARDLMGVHESLRTNENKSVESSNSLRVHESA